MKTTDDFELRIESLKAAFPWPVRQPPLKGPIVKESMLTSGTAAALVSVLSPETRLAVELGTWLGASARFIADRAPASIVIAIDHWQGSEQHHANPRLRPMLPALYENFLSLTWPYRDRIIPLKMRTLDGLRAVADHGLVPDVVYVDADHSYEAVTNDIETTCRLFPSAMVVGDDYDWESVRRAVDDFAMRHGIQVKPYPPPQGGRAEGWKLCKQKAEDETLPGQS